MSETSLPKSEKDESPKPHQKNELNASAQESVGSTVSPTSPPGTSTSDTSVKDTSLFSENGTPPCKRRKGIQFEPQMLSDADFAAMDETMCHAKLKSSLFGETSDEGEDDQNKDDDKSDQTDQTPQSDQTDQNEEADSDHSTEELNSDLNSDPIGDLDEVSQEQAQEEDESRPPQPDRVYLSIVTDHKTVLSFRVNVATKMAKLMGAYSLHSGIPLEAFQLYYRGKPIHKDDTASSLGLEWGDFIDSQTDQDIPQDETPDKHQD